MNAEDTRGHTAVCAACVNGHADVIAYLASRGANVAPRALDVAACAGNVACVEALLAAGADVNEKDVLGYTALEHAVMRDRVGCVQALLAGGADARTSRAQGWTPLHTACLCDSAACAEALIDYGADVNAANYRGQTPLTIAVDNVSRACIVALARGGARFSSVENSILSYSGMRSAISAFEVFGLLFSFGGVIVSRWRGNPSAVNTAKKHVDLRLFSVSDEAVGLATDRGRALLGPCALRSARRLSAPGGLRSFEKDILAHFAPFPAAFPDSSARPPFLALEAVRCAAGRIALEVLRSAEPEATGIAMQTLRTAQARGWRDRAPMFSCAVLVGRVVEFSALRLEASSAEGGLQKARAEAEAIAQREGELEAAH